MTRDIVLRVSNFREVSEVWKRFLWPNRKSPILATSSMNFVRRIDLNIREYGNPIFWVCESRNEIIGVNSGLVTGPSEFRSRGLWVDEEFRKRGVGTRLIAAAEEEALRRNCNVFWSLPRVSALNVYLRAGMRICSEQISDQFEYGPNVYVSKELR